MSDIPQTRPHSRARFRTVQAGLADAMVVGGRVGVCPATGGEDMDAEKFVPTEENAMSELASHAAELDEQLGDNGPGIDTIEDELETLVDEYSVPVDEARKSIMSNYLDESSAANPEPNDEVLVGEINEDEEWVNVRVQVADLWEPRSEKIAQVGLLGDESGTIKFVSFKTSNLPELEEGASYLLTNVVTDEYEGDYSVKMNNQTEITQLDETVEVGDDSTTVMGNLVDVQPGSGLIKRCPHEDCTRVLQSGQCSEHGQVDGEFDLRIKGVIDTGIEVHDVIFDREATAELTGINLDKAKEMAQDALDTEVVVEEMESQIIGQYFEVTGPTLGEYLLANEFTEGIETPDMNAVLSEARSI